MALWVSESYEPSQLRNTSHKNKSKNHQCQWIGRKLRGRVACIVVNQEEAMNSDSNIAAKTLRYSRVTMSPHKEE